MGNDFLVKTQYYNRSYSCIIPTKLKAINKFNLQNQGVIN